MEKKQITLREDPEMTLCLPEGTRARLVASKDVTWPGCNPSTLRVFVLEFQDKELERLLAHASRGAAQVFLLQRDMAAGMSESIVSLKEAMEQMDQEWPTVKARNPWRHAPV